MTVTATIARAVVEHSADPDYWTVHITGRDFSTRRSTLDTADVVRMREVGHVQVIDRRTGEPWSVR